MAQHSSAPGNPIIYPSNNSHVASPNTAVSITYDESIDKNTISTETFAVYAMHTGLVPKVFNVSDGTISLTPEKMNNPGEIVQTSATTGTLNLIGEAPKYPTVWQFRIAVTRGSGFFFDSGQKFENSPGRDIILGDLDLDGDLDAFVTYQGTNKVWLNDGTGEFSDSGQIFGNEHTWRVVLGDVDKDGDPDAIFRNFQRTQVWINDGDGNFNFSGQNLGDLSGFGLAIGDFDGDSDLDLFIANDGNNSNSIWLNDGFGMFNDSGQNLGNSDSRSVAIGDVDGDNDLDAFVGNGSSQPNKIWINNGAGVFKDSGQGIGSLSSASIELGDLDGDGNLDAIIGNQSGGNEIWLNNGVGIFKNSNQKLGIFECLDVAVGDMDGDGDLDVYIANRNWDPNGVPDEVYLNNGKGYFSLSPQELGGYSQSSGVDLGDIDNDGDLDAFVVGYNSVNRIWLNGARFHFPIVSSSLE
jgi:hypothetical protein